MSRAAWCCLAVLWSTAAAAQAPPSVVEVRVEQEGRPVADPELLDLIENKAGQPLSMQQVRESESHLVGLNRFDSVEVVSEPVPGGIRLVYRLFPLHPVDQVTFTGSPGLGEEELRRAIRDRFGTAPLASRAGEIVELLRQVYRDHGYPDARVATRIVERHDPDRATLAIDVEAGTRALIKRVEWVSEDEPQPKTFVGEPDVRANRPYDLAGIQRTLDDYVARMRRSGYYEAVAEPSVDFEPDGAVVRIMFRRGPRVRVVFAGDPLTKAEQQRLVPVQTEASVVEDLLENWEFAIESYLRAQGHHDADVRQERDTNDGELVITFHVSKGPRYVVSSVTFTGEMQMPETDLREVLRLREGDPFIEAALDGGAATIEDLYRARGFVAASVKPSFSVLPSERPADARRVEVNVQIAEGPKTTVRSIAFSGNTAFTANQLRDMLSFTEGSPLSQREIAASRDRIIFAYRDRGFDDVDVRAVQSSDSQGGQTEVGADLLLAVNEGPQLIVDRIIVEGNERTSRRIIERELRVGPGDPLGLTARSQSQERLSALGLFRRVRLDPRCHLGETRCDLVVRVEEAPPTTLSWGGGMEISSRLRPTGAGGAAEERIEFVPRGFLEIGRRNMWGKNRSVSLFTRVSTRSRDTVLDTGTVQSDYGVNEYRVYGTYREPRLFGSFPEFVFTGIAERAIRASYSFDSQEVRAQVGGQISGVYTGAAGFSIGKTRVFDIDPNLRDEEKPLIDRFFPQVRLARFTGSIIRNTRDNDADPSRGTFVSADGSVAARQFGSEVGYVKGFVQGSWYRRLPAARRTIVAARVAIGAAHGFPRTVPDPNDPTVLQIVQDLPASERFFAGGSTTNRGFSLDRLGNADTRTEGGFPKGGNGEILLNGEIRVAVYKGFTGVGFVDTGNIFKDAADMSLTDLRTSAGFGVHYRAPFVGTVRAEVGFNLHRREITPGQLERGHVIHISLGPAF